MKLLTSLEINLDYIREGLRICIYPHRPNTLYDEQSIALKNNEARFQFKEGCFYDYKINNPDFMLGDVGSDIIQQHKLSSHLGTIAPNIYTGTLSIPIIFKPTFEEVGKIEFEVQSAKSGYRDEYRDMLEFITEKCTDLLLQVDSPVSHHFEVDHTQNGDTLYQKFAFIKSIIDTDEFAQAVHKIVAMPVTQWAEITENRDIRRIRRFSNSNTKELIKHSNRTSLPRAHYLQKYGLNSLPGKISSIRKVDSIDTPENRFVKHALEEFLKFCTLIYDAANKFGHEKTKKESEIIIQELENKLSHTFFRGISTPTTLKLNSPVLQRKEGYRDVLHVWLMFRLAAQLTWSGGNNVYRGGKKDVATLYEYWLFFKLLDLLQHVFNINPKDIADLIEFTNDKLELQIKQGKHIALFGIFDSGNRKLNIRFSYNRSFSGNRKYPESGSWTTTLRPDYTLTFWPQGISEQDAEKQELIVHIHFDAKYKVDNLTTDSELNIEKTENRKGVYKNVDLLKMHAYKDAIRRTGGAYILYPGDKKNYHKGFHEIIPGLGAFPVRPSKNNSGIGELKAFILEVFNHFMNRTSQREKLAFSTFNIHQYPPKLEDEVREELPEPYNNNRDLLPDSTYILVGYYQSEEHYDWIKNNKLYNFRIGSDRGSLVLDKETVSSKYLLLHTKGDQVSGKIWKIISKGPIIYSKNDMKNKKYPTPQNQIKDYYLIVILEEVTEPEFKDIKWNFRKLKNYSTGRASAIPFTSTLSELMKCKEQKS